MAARGCKAFGGQPIGHYMADSACHISSAVVFKVKYQSFFVKAVFHACGGRIQTGRAAQAAAFGFQIYDYVAPCNMMDAVIAYAVASGAVHRLSAAEAVCGQRKNQLQNSLSCAGRFFVLIVNIVHTHPLKRSIKCYIFTLYKFYVYISSVFL